MNIDYIRENYMTAPQAAEYLSITRNRVGRLCLEGRFNGAGKIGDTWLIPRESVESHKRLKPGGLTVEKIIAQYEQEQQAAEDIPDIPESSFWDTEIDEADSEATEEDVRQFLLEQEKRCQESIKYEALYNREKPDVPF